MIYRGGDDPLVWYIDQHGWTYSEINKKNVKKMRGRIADRVERFEEHMRSLPREERESFKKENARQINAMGRFLDDDYAKKVRFDNVENDVEIDKWTCAMYEELYDDEFNDSEYYVADWTQLGLTREDVAVFGYIEKNFGYFGSQFTMLSLLWKEEAGGVIDGFAVRIDLYNDGSNHMRLDATEIRQEELSAELFELPDDLDKESFMGLKE